MIKLEIDEKFEELSNLYDLFENITRIDYVPLEYREDIKKELIKAYKDGNQEFEKIHEKLKRLEELEKENNELKEKAQKYDELCKHNVMESQSFGDDLIQGILALNKRVIERNKKFIKIIEILKKYLFLADEKSLVWQKGYEHSTNVSDDDYELLKEVLE